MAEDVKVVYELIQMRNQTQLIGRRVIGLYGDGYKELNVVHAEINDENQITGFKFYPPVFFSNSEEVIYINPDIISFKATPDESLVELFERFLNPSKIIVPDSKIIT